MHTNVKKILSCLYNNRMAHFLPIKVCTRTPFCFRLRSVVITHQYIQKKLCHRIPEDFLIRLPGFFKIVDFSNQIHCIFEHKLLVFVRRAPKKCYMWSILNEFPTHTGHFKSNPNLQNSSVLEKKTKSFWEQTQSFCVSKLKEPVVTN